MIIVIVGASGSGKTTIGKMLERNHIPPLVSFTTRDKRKDEVPGYDYHFINKEAVDLLEEDDIVEFTEYNGNYYGLFKTEVDSKLGRYGDTYFVANADGAQKIADRYPEETIVFWLDVDIETMVLRMRERGDKEEDILSRVEHAIDTKELKKPELNGIEVYRVEADQDLEDIVDYMLETVDKVEAERGLN